MASPVKVLILEDERLIAENSAIILKNLGYQVTKICSSVKAASEEILINRPDIVLVDILLKGNIDGISFAEELRSDHDIPFVYVTATADDAILDRAKLTSPYGYVVKPFNERDLHSNIEIALYKYQTEVKIQHINEMLYALNAINQLNERNDSVGEYLQKLCDSLASSPSLSYIWAGLMDEDRKVFSMAHQSKDVLEVDVNPLLLDHSLAPCMLRAYEQDGPLVNDCSAPECVECGLGRHFPGRNLVSVRISFEHQIFGVLTAIVLPSVASDPEFLRLFAEVSHKAGVVIHNLATQEQVGKVQKALAMVEARFNRFTALAEDLILVYDIDGTILYINPSGEKLIGYPQEQILSSKLEHFLAPRSIAQMDEMMKTLSRGTVGNLRYEIYLRSQSGEEIPMEVNSNPILEDGEHRSFLLIGRDMRERKRQQAELEKLSSVVDQSPSAIIITDADGHITYVNPKFTTMTGFTREEVIGKFPAILKTEHITDEIATELIQTSTQGKVWRGELKTLRANREQFWADVTVSALLDENGRNSYIAIVEDITEKRRAARELKVSKQSYEDIFNSSSDAIYLQDENGVFIDVNKGATKMYQYNHDYLVGKTPADIAAEGKNDLEELKRALKRAYEGESVSFEFWGKRKNGEEFPKEVHVNRVNYFGKHVLMATARDITPRKRIEADLKAAAARAEESEKVKGYFLANMSHEIRTPLTSIVGYIDLIFSRIKDHLSDKDSEYFDIIRRNSDRLTRAVHSIIDLSQIEAGATKVEKGSVNLNQLVDMVYNDHRVAAERKELGFHFHRADQLFWMSGDKYLLQTAISNLVDNAISYTEEGQVDIFLTPGPDQSCNLIIKDTGIGIAHNSLNSIFESFNQESMGYTKDYQGLGLGLTLAKKNFELHNVKIEVESEKGHGSSFTVRFTELLSDADARRLQEALERPHIPDLLVPLKPVNPDQPEKLFEPSSRQHILIVEDDENAQRLFGLFLKNNYDIYFAATVAEARKVLEAKTIALVLTDLSLVGGESGLDLVEWIRNQPQYQALPVVALTAHAFVSDRQKCLDAGCNDFITKPIFRSQLLDVIGHNLTG